MPEPVPAADNRDEWLTPQRFAMALAVLTFAAFPHILLGLQTFTYRDFGGFSYPLASYFRECFWRGEIPMWNPLNQCGVPFLAQWNTQVLYPPAIFYLIFPLAWSLPVFCLLHLYLGGLGMFFLARRWSGNAYAAAFAGVVFAFSGLMQNGLMWPATIPGLGWMPWLVLFSEQAWREGGRAIFAAVLVGALQMLSGAVEVILLSWLLLAALFAREFLLAGTARWKMIFRAASVPVLVALLCAAQLLPFLDLVRQSSRVQNFDSASWPMPPSGWLNFLAPQFLAHVTNLGVFQSSQAWTASYYVGAFTIALAVWTVWRVGGGKVWLLVIATVLCLLLALGTATPVYLWIKAHTGVVGLMRFPVKFVILPEFTLPLMAALAVANLGRKPPGKDWWLLCGIILVTMISLVWLSWELNIHPACGAASAWNAAQRVVLFAGLAGLFFFTVSSAGDRRRRLLQVAVLAGAWFDLYTHMPIPKTVPPEVYQSAIPRQLPSPRFGTSRAMISNESLVRIYYYTFTNAVDDFIVRRYGLAADCNLLENIPKVDGFYPLDLRNYALFAQFFYSSNAPDATPEPLLDFVGVSQINPPGDTFQWVARTNFMPLITGGQNPVFKDERETMAAIIRPDFNPRREVYLLPEAKPSVRATNADVKILQPHFAAEEISADVVAAAPTMVVVAQVYYRPWHAYLDGQRVELFRANLGFQAVPVPAGQHHLSLRYEDRSFHLGAGISLTTLTGCCLGVTWIQIRRRESKIGQKANPTS